MFFQTKQGSQNRFASKCFQEEVFRKRYSIKVPSKLVPKQGSQEKISRQDFQEEVSKQGYQTRLRNRFPGKRFCKGFQEGVSKHSFQEEVLRPRQQVSKQGSL